MGTDTLSEVLRAVRLTGAVFFTIDASAPWAAETPAAADIGSLLAPRVDHVIEYHVVITGTCWGGIVDEPAAVQLEAGDVVVFTQGDPHVMSSAPGMRCISDRASLQHAMPTRLPIAIKKDGGGPERAQLICGYLGCDARPFNPLLATLPRMIHLPGGAADGSAIGQLVKLALAESTNVGPGSEAMIAHLSELLFVEVVRRHVATLPPENVGWLAGLRDDSVGRALGKLHDRPAHDWSLDELARDVGMSRSVLAERFTHFVGVPAMQYLMQWRMQLAATLLSTSSLGLDDIAARVGYSSQTALSRAYKRWVGVAPADWRQGKRA